MQSKGLFGVTRRGKKTTRVLTAAGNFPLMFAQQSSSDLSVFTTDHSTVIILTSAQKHAAPKTTSKKSFTRFPLDDV